MLLYLVALIVGIGIISKAGDLFVESAQKIALALGVSAGFIALTLIAFATSAPEFFTSLIAAALGNYGISYGNVVGSNIINIDVVLAIGALFGIASIEKNNLIDGLLMIIISGVLVLFSLNGAINWIEGVILLVLFILFVWTAKKKDVGGSRPKKPANLKKLVAIFCFAAVGLFVGARLLVYGGAGIAQGILTAAGLTPLEAEAVVGFTVIAIGTSLPELATIIVSIRKKLYDISIGTIIGSNIFNIGLIVGTASLATTAKQGALLVDSQAIWVSNPIMLLSAVLLTAFMFKRRTLTKLQGVLFLLLYAVYLSAMLLFYSG